MSRENDLRKKDRKRHIICGIIGICISSVLTGMIIRNRAEAVERKTGEIQERISEEVFRFHVLANSDSEKDQKIKLAVRDAVLDFMKESMGRETSASETKAWALSHLEELEETACQVLEEKGFDYKARAKVVNGYFPEKRYGDMVFPEGNYEGLRMELGKASGHNWWCVLYPNLCFIDTTCAVVSDEGKEELKETLKEDEYAMITTASEFKIKWFFFGDGAFGKDTKEEK